MLRNDLFCVPEFFKRFSDHHLGPYLGQLNPYGLAHERNCAASSGVYLNYVNLAVLYGKLDINKPSHLE